MSKQVLIDDSILTMLADALREKTLSQDKIPASELGHGFREVIDTDNQLLQRLIIALKKKRFQVDESMGLGQIVEVLETALKVRFWIEDDTLYIEDDNAKIVDGVLHLSEGAALLEDILILEGG